ncbi:MAG: site-2 protease family protein [Clostridia bacterium]|nr:site-2 protease family protein [Clostridia bacterium]
MKIKRGETDVKINVSFAAAITCMLILDESGVCAVALFCCFIHEAAHIICMLALGEKPALVELSFYGIKLERKPVCRRRYDIAVYVSGPAANLIMWALISVFCGSSESAKTTAYVSLAVGVFNLLPCRPLDGGNILHEALCRFMPEEKADRICDGAVFAVLVPLSLFSFAAALEFGNITLGGAAVYLAAVTFFDKREKGTVKL